MKLGLIARADNSGVGNQTKTMYDHIPFHRTLVIDMEHHGRTGKTHLDRYPDAWKVVRDLDLTPQICEQFVKGLDAVYTAETPYAYCLYEIAREHGVRTIQHTNPEFWRYDLEPDWPRPDLVVLPTIWRKDHIPFDAILPTPVDRRLLPFRQRKSMQRVLHIAGHRAMGDRNGTQLTQQAIRHIKQPMEFVLRSQAPLPSVPFNAKGRHVKVKVEPRNLENLTDLFKGADVLLMPRRYAGQALAMNEALSLGMPVICLDREPENTWGGCLPVAAHVQRKMRSQVGPLPVYGAVPRHVAAALDELAQDNQKVAALSQQADEYARSISWANLREDWLHVFEGRKDLVKWSP